MLPFEPEIRKNFTCFCCGLKFELFNEYKQHILEKHEEGRDYVLCPLSFCRAPVRCTKTHLVSKHPGIEIPKDKMKKALIWHDFTSSGKKTRKPRFRDGFYESSKMKKKLKFRSSWEALVYKCLDSDTTVLSFDVEPIRIKYIHKGKLRDYIPDIIVKFIDSRVEMWEIKPSAQTLLPINIAKWEAAENACKNRCWLFRVMTEQEIQKYKQKIKIQQLNG